MWYFSSFFLSLVQIYLPEIKFSFLYVKNISLGFFFFFFFFAWHFLLSFKLFFIKGWGYSILIMVSSLSRSKLEIFRRQSTHYFWYPFSRFPLLNIQDCCSHTQTYIPFFFFFNPVVYSTKSMPHSDKRKPNSPVPQSRKRISRHVSETPSPQAPSRKPSSPVPQSRKQKSRHDSETPSPQAQS